MPAMTKNLALELAPVRVNLIGAGFVDTPLSASLLGDQLDARREQLRTTLPIGRVVGPTDIAALDFRPVLYICALHAHQARPLRVFLLYRVDNRIHAYSIRTARFGPRVKFWRTTTVKCPAPM